jgi:hypothetical protein
VCGGAAFRVSVGRRDQGLGLGVQPVRGRVPARAANAAAAASAPADVNASGGGSQHDYCGMPSTRRTAIATSAAAIAILTAAIVIPLRRARSPCRSRLTGRQDRSDAPFHHARRSSACRAKAPQQRALGFPEPVLASRRWNGRLAHPAPGALSMASVSGGRSSACLLLPCVGSGRWAGGRLTAGARRKR